MKSNLRSSKKSWVLFILIFCGFIVFLTLLYLRLVSVRSEAAKDTGGESPVPVKVISVKKTDGWLYREVLGRVEGLQELDIRTNVSGWVKRKNLERGESVEEDDVIIELEDQRTEAAYSEAVYNLESAKARLKESRRKYRQNLVLLEKGIISRDTLEQSENQVNIDSANVSSLEASLARIKFNYDKLKVRSPIDGQIVEVIPDIGQEVLDGDVVARVVNLEQIRVVAGVDARLARSLTGGLEVKLSLSADDINETATGKVTGVSRNFSDSSGIYEVEVEITDENTNWLPGEIVSLKFPQKKYENAVEIPRSAVLSDSDEVFVFVVVNGVSKKVPVDITWLNDELGYTEAGNFSENAQVVTEGSAGLSSGQKVKVLN